LLKHSKFILGLLRILITLKYLLIYYNYLGIYNKLFYYPNSIYSLFLLVPNSLYNFYKVNKYIISTFLKYLLILSKSCIQIIFFSQYFLSSKIKKIKNFLYSFNSKWCKIFIIVLRKKNFILKYINIFFFSLFKKNKFFFFFFNQ
jgi:hypothetical protein